MLKRDHCTWPLLYMKDLPRNLPQVTKGLQKKNQERERHSHSSLLFTYKTPADGSVESSTIQIQCLSCVHAAILI